MTTRAEKDARRKAAIEGTGEKVIQVPSHTPGFGGGFGKARPGPRELPFYTRLGEVNGKTYEIAELGRWGTSRPPSIVKVFRRTPGGGLEVLSSSEAGMILAFLEVQAELEEMEKE